SALLLPRMLARELRQNRRRSSHECRFAGEFNQWNELELDADRVWRSRFRGRKQSLANIRQQLCLGEAHDATVLSARASASANEPSSAGSHCSMTKPAAHRMSSRTVRLYL